jgi:hypothetical protein
MGSYALGYCSPPLPPGGGPEVVPPGYALSGGGAGFSMGSNPLLASITVEVRGEPVALNSATLFHPPRRATT